MFKTACIRLFLLFERMVSLAVTVVDRVTWYFLKRLKQCVDAGLYAFGAMFIFQQGFLSNDDAYKYINPITLFWMKYATGSLAAGCAALKAYLSDYKQNHGETHPPLDNAPAPVKTGP